MLPRRVAGEPEDGAAAAAGRGASGGKDDGVRRRPLTGRQAAKIVATSPKLFLIIASTMLLMPTFDLNTLLPLYLDSLGMDAQRIGTIGSLYPLAAVPVILGTGALHQRLSPWKRVFLYAPLLAAASAALFALSVLNRATQGCFNRTST